MSEKKRAIIDYIVACVNDFSEAHQMDCVSGFDFLQAHDGVGFLERNYDVEHAYSIEDAIADMTDVCRRNGGDCAAQVRRRGIVMSVEARQLIEFAAQDLVAEIVERDGLSIQDAMAQLYHSEFFKQLTNPSFGLYRESGTYLYAAYHASLGNPAKFVV